MVAGTHPSRSALKRLRLSVGRAILMKPGRKITSRRLTPEKVECCKKEKPGIYPVFLFEHILRIRWVKQVSGIRME